MQAKYAILFYQNSIEQLDIIFFAAFFAGNKKNLFLQPQKGNVFDPE
jgi:hypothetical protein